MSKPQQHASAPTIRPLETNDLDAVLDLSIAAWQPVFDSFAKILGSSIFDHLYAPDWESSQRSSVKRVCLDDEMEPFVVVAESGGVAGYIALAHDTESDIGIVEQIAVHPDHQRRGYARALMEFAIERFQSKGVAFANVGTGGDPGHAPARALYEAVEFTALPLVNYYKAIDQGR